jgi:3D (Asp-Asp-Asp) domain-containing protein
MRFWRIFAARAARVGLLGTAALPAALPATTAMATALVAITQGGCAGSAPEEQVDVGDGELSSAKSFRARGTAYYPSNDPIEGGFVDRKGAPLRTLQDFLAGRAEYVSVAMDVNAFAYGTHLRIAQLEAKYGRAIDFRVVDTGGAFRGKGTSRIDICVKSYRDSLDATINGMLDIRVGSSAPSGSSTAAAPSESSGRADDSSNAPTGGSGDACSNDGACNPGSDGSGRICEGGRCVPGCRRDYHCPDTQVCRQGSCQ